MIACLLIPGLELLAACANGRGAPPHGPAALAPVPGRPPLIGQASAAAEPYGIRAGMRLGEALARCPGLELVPPDPVATSDLWERALQGLEGIGAAVQAGGPGEAYFEAEGLRGLHGGLDGVVGAAREAVGLDDAIGASPCFAVASSSFAARLAAVLEDPPASDNVALHGLPLTSRRLSGSGASYRVVDPDRTAELLGPLPVSGLTCALPGSHGEPAGADPGMQELVGSLEQLGLGTLGSFAALDPGMVADRFGAPGRRAHRLAAGGAEPLRTRPQTEHLEESLELPDSLDGELLENALRLLVDRLLALPERRGRSIRSVTLSATLTGGGSWRTEAPLNSPTASAELLGLVLAPRLAELPGPASSLGLRASELGDEAAEQSRLTEAPGEARRDRLAEAVRQARVTAGPDSLLRVLELDPSSRLPERRAVLSPRDAGSTGRRR